MLRKRVVKIAFWLGLAALTVPLALAQDAAVLNPPPYRGVDTHMDGIFVTPVPNAPFSGTAELRSIQVLPDGMSETRRTIVEIARDSQGRIHNERRRLVSPSFNGTPQIVSIHIYDPETRLSTFLDPFTHIARESRLARPEIAPGSLSTPAARTAASDPLVQEEDLGTEMMDNLSVHGIRKTRTVPAALSGTGKAISVTDEY